MWFLYKYYVMYIHIIYVCDICIMSNYTYIYICKYMSYIINIIYYVLLIGKEPSSYTRTQKYHRTYYMYIHFSRLQS